MFADSRTEVANLSTSYHTNVNAKYGLCANVGAVFPVAETAYEVGTDK